MRSLIDKIKHFIEPLYNWIYRLCISWFYFLPIKKGKIVFIQGCGEGYRCNLKYIAEEIHRQRLPYDIVWLVEFWNIEIPSFIRKIKYNRIRAVYELATCEVMINNSKSLYPVKKKKAQRFIYVPHGQPGCKCAEGDAVLTENYIAASKTHSALTDVFVSMGTYHTQVLKDTFWIPKSAVIWETGFPRNDNYYRDTTQQQAEIRKKLNIADEVQIALYAPTFRDSGDTSAYNLDLRRVLDSLERKTGKKWLMFITMHDCFKWFPKPQYAWGDDIIDMSGYTDVHELMLIVDLVISDYSSMSLDFANTRKPVLLYASDIEQYRKARGLKEMYFHLPFTLSRNNDEMEQAIIHFDLCSYKEKLESFNETRYHSIDDGHAAERFIERMKLITNSRHAC